MAAHLSPNAAPGRNASVLSPARRVLAAINARIAEFEAERMRAQRQVVQIQPAADELNHYIARHQAEQTALLAPGVDPEAYGDHLFAANRLAQKISEIAPRVDLAGLRAALAEVQTANVQLGHWVAERDRAVAAVEEEEAEAIAAEHLAPAVARVLQLRALLEPMSLRIALMVRDAIAAVGVEPDPTAARRYREELIRDPQARLQVPTGAASFTISPVTRPRPMEDGSRFINRGEALPSPQTREESDPGGTPSEAEPPNTANSALPAEAIPGPTFAPMPDTTLPAWMAPNVSVREGLS